MSQSLTQVYLHIVFSTKNRAPYLRDGQIRQRLYGYLVGACNNLGSPSLQIGGVDDHIHILCRLGKTISISDLVRELKRESSKWIKGQVPSLAAFHWQSGYGAFSLSPAHVDPARAYIQNQEEHHRTETFQDEFRRICRKNNIELDERYVWD